MVIDIGGWAGAYEYLEPEMQDVFGLSQLGLGVLVKNDCQGALDTSVEGIASPTRYTCGFTPFSRALTSK